MDKHFKVLDHQDWKQIIINNKKETKNPSKKKISQAQQKKILNYSRKLKRMI